MLEPHLDPFLDEFLNSSGCNDLGFTSSPFTWHNKRLGLAHIKQG